MCGICGKYSLKGKVEPSLIEAMCAALAHRGPDDAGVYVNECVGLGNRRLAVIDLSPAGHMPMSDPSGKLWLTYNGEIYNFRELRGQLQDSGYSFHSNTDTEVALYAYHKWGPGCLDRFNGMFGLATWDNEKRSLFLARDRLGVKPLYYYFDGATLIFASEIKAILRDPQVPREIGREGMLNYFAFGHSLAPHTIFKNIFKLSPGHYLTCAAGDGPELRISIRRYWAPPVPRENEDRGEHYYIEEVRRLLGESVKRRLVSDVPLGVFLSGGIDSSIVTGLMSSLSPSRVKTFSIGFPVGGRAYNELEDARTVARHFGTEHHELVLDDKDLVRVLPDLVYQYDEPFGDSASFPTYILSRFARERITVALSGEGGDEVFGGYRRYVVEDFLAHHPVLFSLLGNKAVLNSLRRLPRLGKGQKLVSALLTPDGAERYTCWFAVFNREMRERLLNNNGASDNHDFDPLDVYRRLYALDGVEGAARLLYIDQQTWLPDTYLEKVDKASMAVNLEVRVPFLDYELVEFAARVPGRYKVRGFATKYILKKAFADLLPAATLRKRKHGFAVPLDPWLVNKLGPFAQDVLFDDRTRSRGLFNQEYVRDLYRLHGEGKGPYHRQLWLLIVFELWCRAFLDRAPGAASVTSMKTGAESR